MSQLYEILSRHNNNMNGDFISLRHPLSTERLALQRWRVTFRCGAQSAARAGQRPLPAVPARECRPWISFPIAFPGLLRRLL